MSTTLDERVVVRQRPHEITRHDRRTLAALSVVVLCLAVALLALLPAAPTAHAWLLLPCLALGFLLRGPHAAYGGRRGPSVEASILPAVQLLAVPLVPPVLLPLLAAPYLVPRRTPALWRLVNIAQAVGFLAVAAFVLRLMTPADAAPVPGGVATLAAVLASWAFFAAWYSWIQYVTQGQTPRETYIWTAGPMALELSVRTCGLTAGVLVAAGAQGLPGAAALLATATLLIVTADRSSDARRDSKTGLYTLACLLEWGEHHVRQARRRGSELAVLMIDIDHFRRFNTDFGHDAGDAALELVSRALCLGRRSTDVVARYGGEEFAVLLPETGKDGASTVAEEMRARIASLVLSTDRGERAITTSVGVAVLRDEETMDELMRRADIALYAAKDAGRDCVRSAD